MAADRTTCTIWLIGPQAGALRATMPSSEQEAMRCFVSLAELPSPGQVRHAEYPDLLVLDVTAEPEALTRIDELRRTWLVGVLALAPDCATAERCLLAGAGDVLVGRCTPAEARLRANRLLRAPAGPLRIGDLVLDLRTREVRLWQEQVCLTPLEYDLLTYLLRNADRVVTFDELLDEVWGYPAGTGDPAQVRNAVRRLRAKLGNDANAPHYIANVWGIGYRWIGPLSPAPCKDNAPRSNW